MISKKSFDKRNPIVLATIISFVLFTICISFIMMFYYSTKQRKILEVTERYVVVESKIERLIYSNITLLQGYEAYIKSNPEQEEESSYTYLENLLSENADYIRNIGLIKDTTIIRNYPKASNAATIGIDLAKNEEQKELVLKVKTELKPVFQGPVNLVQGGSGFIVRLPLVRDDTGYWGQISIVLDSDKLRNEIDSYIESSGLNITISNKEGETTPFFGSAGSDRDYKMNFDIDPALINWKACVYTPNVWFSNFFLFVISIIFSTVVSAFVGILLYKYLKANNLIFNMSIHDSLSGLYNRHFLEEHQAIVLSAARRNKRKVGIMLLDLNKFKSINDTYGHDVGDKVLIETSRILKESTRTNEAAFRLGGDEFLIIIPEVENEESLYNMKGRLLESFEKEFLIFGHSIKITPSIGCAIFPEDGDDIDSLLRVADEEMYKEKQKN